MKLESWTELEAARGLRACGLSEEWATERSKRVFIVDMVQKQIERIDGEGGQGAFIFGRGFRAQLSKTSAG